VFASDRVLFGHVGLKRSELAPLTFIYSREIKLKFETR
jgi:hypothetical protein